MATPNHQRLVLNVYPKSGETHANDTALSYLQYYVEQRPVKLLKVGAFLEKKIDGDYRSKNVVNLKISVDILKHLIKASHGNVGAFSPYVMHVVARLLKSEDLEWISLGTNLFVNLAAVNSNDLASSKQNETRDLLVEIIEAFASLASHVGDGEHNVGCRLQGLKGISATVSSSALLRAENQPLLEKVIPVAWTTLRHATIADLRAFDDNANPVELNEYSSNAVIVAAAVIKEAAARVTATSAPLIISKMFSWMAEHNLWETAGLFEQMFKLISGSLTPKYTNLFVVECTKRLSSKSKDQPEAFRTRLISILNYILTNANGNSSGVSLFELLDSLANHVTPGLLDLPEQVKAALPPKEVVESESTSSIKDKVVGGGQELNLAIFSCVEKVSTSVVSNSVKYDCLELLLNRLSKEDERTKQNAEEEQISLHGPFLQIIYTVATINTESDFVTEFNPTVLTAFANLLNNNNRVVRLTSFAIIKRIFFNLSAKAPGATLSSKTRKENATKLIDQFGQLLHKRLYDLLTIYNQVSPSDYAVTYELLTALIELFGLPEIATIVPILIKVQAENAALDATANATRKLVANHFVVGVLAAVAAKAKSAKATEWLSKYQSSLESKKQWKPLLDFSVSEQEQQLLRDSSMAKLEKRLTRKDETALAIPEAIAAFGNPVDSFVNDLVDAYPDAPGAIVTALKSEYTVPSEQEIQLDQQPALGRNVTTRRKTVFMLGGNETVSGTRARTLMEALQPPKSESSAASAEGISSADIVPAPTTTDLSLLLAYKPRHLEDSDNGRAADDEAEEDSSDDEDYEKQGHDVADAGETSSIDSNPDAPVGPKEHVAFKKHGVSSPIKKAVTPKNVWPIRRSAF